MSINKMRGGRVKPDGSGPSKKYPKGTGVANTGRMGHTFTRPTPKSRTKAGGRVSGN